MKTAFFSLLINFAYALGNCIMGFITHSWWFVSLGAYYLVLTITRFSLLQIKRSNNYCKELELYVKRVTGILVILLSFCFIGIIILSTIKDRGSRFHEIIMIAIATYAFTKVTLAIIGLTKLKGVFSPVEKALRNITLIDAFVSIYSLQRSMLVSFPGMAKDSIQLFNILTGSSVWILILLLGINLIGGRRVNMAKSKIVKANEKIAENVVSGYKKIEKGVVNGYKKIQDNIVSGYTKIEDKFVDAYLTKEGESVEEAKKRIKNQNK